jgi:hypothetical protein
MQMRSCRRALLKKEALAVMALCLVAGATAHAGSPCLEGFEESREELHPAITLHLHRCDEPLYRAFVLELDLEAEGVSYVVTERGAGRMATSAFAESVGAFAAINGGFRTEDGGYTVSSGEIWGKRGDTEYGSVVGFGRWSEQSGRTRVDIRPPEEVLEDVPGWMEHAVTGYPLVLDGGEVVEEETPLAKLRHPRTGLGLDEHGRTLYLVAVDGRQSGWSWGMRTWQLGELLRSVGAHRAVNLDGGGSTTMVVPSRGGVVNRPCDKKAPERPVLNHVGVIVEEQDPALAAILDPARWLARTAGRLRSIIEEVVTS